MQTYHQYINSPEWREKRQGRLNHDDRRCTRCQDASQLEVHHISYERLGCERLEDLVTLCHSCHAREHGRDPDLPGEYPIEAAFWTWMERDLERERLEDEQAALLERLREEAA